MPSYTLALLALAASLVSAQIDLSKIPTCALPAAVSALSTSGCLETDIKCLCSSTTFLTTLEPAVQAACSAADIQKASDFASSLCLSVGITIAIPGVGPSTSAAPAAPTTSAVALVTSSAPASSAPAASSVAPVPSSSAAAPVSSVAGVSTVYVTVPCTTSTSSAASVVVVPTTSKASNVTVTPTKSATPSTFTGAAAAVYVSGATLFGGAVAAIAMML